MTTSRIALVTGGTRGIGRAVVGGLAERGFTVLLGARDLDRGTAVAAELAQHGDVRAIALDVTSDEDVQDVAEQVRVDNGHLDVLVNNAGVNAGGYAPPTEETAEDLRTVYETNVFAVVRVTNALLPALLRAPAGRIVNVTSKRGSIGEPGAWVGTPSMAYSSSKTALNAVTAHYAHALADTPVLVNGAAPGHVATDFNDFHGTRTPAAGAEVVLHLATLGPDGPTGIVLEDRTRLSW